MNLAPLGEQLLEYLRRKGGPIGLGRIVDDHKRPAAEIEANLSQLRRLNLARAPSPGMWEATPPPRDRAGAGVEVPVTAETAARPIAEATMRQVAVPRREVSTPPAPSAATTEEHTMPRGVRHCPSCKRDRGNRAFEPGAETCRECAQAPAKPRAKPKARKARRARHATPAPSRREGRFDDMIANLELERDGLDQAIAALRRLG